MLEADEDFVQQVCDLLFEISQESLTLTDEAVEAETEPGKRAVIMVTHDPTGASYGTRLVKIRDGLIESDEPVVPQ